MLARPAGEITLAQIVSAVDGPIVAGDFGAPHTNGACDHEGQCVLLAVWADVSEHMRTHLSSFTLADMVARATGSVPSGPPLLEEPVLTAVGSTARPPARSAPSPAR